MSPGPFDAVRYARRYANWREVRSERAAGRNPARVVLRDGTRFDSPANVNAARMTNGIWFNRMYTPPGFEIGSDEAVVDLGANIGVFAVFAGARTRGPVVAVEPSPENLPFLRRNLEMNGCPHARVLPCAVSDETGTAQLFLARKGVTNQIFPGRTGSDDSVEVEATTLERIVEDQGLDRIGFLKMDCEGAEGLVLRSASPELLARIRCIAMEFHDDASPMSHGQIQELLETNGFAVELRWNGRAATGLLFARRREPEALPVGGGERSLCAGRSRGRASGRPRPARA